MDAKTIVQNFYNGLSLKDDSWQKDLSDGVLFADASNTLHAEGKDAFIQSFTPFLKGIEHVTVKKFIVENTTICAIVGYDFINPKGERMHQDDAEVWEIQEGKVTSLIVYFDITAFRTFMRPQ